MINQLAAAAHGFDEVDVAEFRRWKEAGSPIVPRGTANLPGPTPPRVPGPPTGMRVPKSRVSFKTNSRSSTLRRRPKPFSSTPAPAATTTAPAATFVTTTAQIEPVPRNLREDPDAILPADSPTPPVGTAATRAARAAAAAEKWASLRF